MLAKRLNELKEEIILLKKSRVNALEEDMERIEKDEGDQAVIGEMAQEIKLTKEHIVEIKRLFEKLAFLALEGAYYEPK